MKTAKQSFNNFNFIRISLAAMLLLFVLGSFSVHAHTDRQARIQLAILLDTSNSMDGLIDQTRSQLWSMVDELSKAKKMGQHARLEVAVLEYGNNNLSPQQGYIRTVTKLTSDLDLVSEALFNLRTNGGDEFCGYAINTAVNQLAWSPSSRDLKLIYIAGNEPFTQGPISYQSAINLARNRDITVSTIFAGHHHEGVATGWQQGALMAGGNFMSVDHNIQVVHIDAPQDKRISELNKKLNDTYVPYGRKGREAKQRQTMQDSANASVSMEMLAKRAKSKASSLYSSGSWDLVDAMEEEDFDLSSLAPEALPAEVAALPKPERKAYLNEKKTEREAIKSEIQKLSEEREVYVTEERKKLAKKEGETVNDVLISSIKEQAEKKAYEFD